MDIVTNYPLITHKLVQLSDFIGEISFCHGQWLMQRTSQPIRVQRILVSSSTNGTSSVKAQGPSERGGRKVLSQQCGRTRTKQHRHYRTLHSRTHRPMFASTRPAKDKVREQSGMEEKELMSSRP